MAQQVKSPQFGIVLRQNRNSANKSFGKYFPEAATRKTISMRGLVEHMEAHQTIYSRDIIEGVITKAVFCMAHLLSEGNPIKLDGLGTFSPVVEATKGGITLTELEAGKWNPDLYIAGVHLRFLPEGGTDDKLTSRAFKQKCSFATNGVLEPVDLTPDEEVASKKKWGYKTVPLDIWLAEQSNSQGGGGGNGGSQSGSDGSGSGNGNGDGGGSAPVSGDGD